MSAKRKNVIITSGHPDIDSFVEFMIKKFPRDGKWSALAKISNASIHKLFNPDDPDDRFDMFNTDRDATVLIGIQDVLDAERRNKLLERYERAGCPVLSRHVLVIARHEDDDRAVSREAFAYDKAVYLTVSSDWLAGYESGHHPQLLDVCPKPDHYI